MIHETPRTLAVIPARGQSKGIPQKNLSLMGGKPLLAWTLLAAKAAQHLQNIVVTTDDETIAKCANNHGVSVIDRPCELADDHVHASQAVLHAVQIFESTHNLSVDQVMMLLPTCPFRTHQHIDDAIHLLSHYSHAQSVIGLRREDKNLNNFRHLEENYAVPVFQDQDLHQQRQDFKPLYAVNGAIFLAKKNDFLQYQSFHTPKTLGYMMSWVASLDINTPHDLWLANILYQHEVQS